LIKNGVNLIFGQEVNSITFDDVNMCWQVSSNSNIKSIIYEAKDVIYTAPPQSLLKHLKDPLERKKNY